MRDPLTPSIFRRPSDNSATSPMRHSPMSKSEEQHPSPEFSNASQSRVVKGRSTHHNGDLSTTQGHS